MQATPATVKESLTPSTPAPLPTPAAAILIPALADGERYAGIAFIDGQPHYHLILLPGEAERVTWQQASDWAASIGGELPTREEQALLYANLKSEFRPTWYWSGTQYSPGFAWSQDFDDGYQDDDREYDGGRARAVRRLAI